MLDSLEENSLESRSWCGWLFSSMRFRICPKDGQIEMPLTIDSKRAVKMIRQVRMPEAKIQENWLGRLSKAEYVIK